MDETVICCGMAVKRVGMLVVSVGLDCEGGD